MRLMPLSRPWIYWVARCILAMVFIYAAVLKIRSPQEFADSIAAYRILPFSVINVVALGLPFFELACGVLVLTGIFLRVGICGIFTMLVLFVGAMTMALMRGFTIDCGCFVTRSLVDSNPWLGLVRDGFLLCLAVLVYRRSIYKKSATIDSLAEPA